MSDVEVFDRGYTRRVEVGQRRDGTDLTLLFYADGAVRVHHHCKLIQGDSEDRLICAPALQIGAGHVVMESDPVTISPSILCPDCALHGFVRASRWEEC